MIYPFSKAKGLAVTAEPDTGRPLRASRLRIRRCEPPLQESRESLNYGKGARQPAFNTSRETASFLAVTPNSSLRAPAAGIARKSELQKGGAATCLHFTRKAQNLSPFFPDIYCLVPNYLKGRLPRPFAKRNCLDISFTRGKGSRSDRRTGYRETASCLAVTPDSSLRAPVSGIT